MHANLQIKKKTLSRADWPRILQSSSAYQPLGCGGFSGMASLLRLEKTKEPFAIQAFGQDVTLVDDGYFWLQIAPQGENWWLTVMFDREKRIIQFYFDITKENVLCGEQSYFWDLFLDVVAKPDGRLVLVDQDELDAALAQGIISAQEHQLAVETADRLMAQLPAQITRLERFCYRLFEELQGK